MGRLSCLKSLFVSGCFSSPNSEKRKSSEKFARKRLVRELKQMKTDEHHPTHVSYAPVSRGNMFKWQGIIMGCTDTPFEGGIFKLSVELPIEYPYKPPKIKFLTKVYHPNIDSDGRILIDILGDQWTPVLTIEALVLSICSVLHEPALENIRSPISTMYLHQTDQYNKIARMWTRKYAV